MTKQEATDVIGTWLKTYSAFTADALSITPAQEGAWVVLVECGKVRWEQKVSPGGEVSPPVWVD